MERTQLVPDFRLAIGNNEERPFHEFLADFNILAIRRVPSASHGPATQLLRRLLAENRRAEDATIRGFDIRSPDCLCDAGPGPHIVFEDQDLVTICDSDRSIYEQFGIAGDDRFFVVGSDGQMFDVGSIQEIDQWMTSPAMVGAPTPNYIARAPPDSEQAA